MSCAVFERLQVQSVAQLGVHLLLFTLGLEFSLTKLRAVRNVALFGGLLQARAWVARTGRGWGALPAACCCRHCAASLQSSVDAAGVPPLPRCRRRCWRAGSTKLPDPLLGLADRHVCGPGGAGRKGHWHQRRAGAAWLLDTGTRQPGCLAVPCACAVRLCGVRRLLWLHTCWCTPASSLPHIPCQ